MSHNDPSIGHFGVLDITTEAFVRAKDAQCGALPTREDVLLQRLSVAFIIEDSTKILMSDVMHVACIAPCVTRYLSLRWLSCLVCCTA